MFGYDDKPLLERVLQLSKSLSEFAILIERSLESQRALKAEIELLNRRINRLEQKSSISYLKPLDPNEGAF